MQSVIVLACLLTVNLWTISSSSKSGIYLDNGYDQTTIERLMTVDEKKEMELEILNVLGLPHRPRRVNRKPLNKSALRFLFDIYASLMEEEHGEKSRRKRSSDVYISGEEQNKIDESDVIMTFESSSHHVPGVRHERGKRLWFNVSDVPVAEDIVGAELKIHKTKGKNTKNLESKYTVTIYQLIKTDDGERELEYVSAQNTTAGYSGWISLNVTACLSSWVAFPDSNKGVYLSVHPTDRPGHEIRPEDLGLVTVKGDDETQPFMVAFLKAVNHVKPRVARDIRTKREPLDVLVRKYRDLDKPAQRSCRIETLYISFKDLKWQDWIIAPDGYAAYYCVGECNFPLNAHMNATNHAIVQTLVHLMNPLRTPKPCCAPTKLGAIPVLYFLDDQDQNVTLKKYKKMVVKTCGCH